MTIFKNILPGGDPGSLGFTVLAQKTYSDPVAYCKAVGTIDKPDARYTGPEAPSMDGQATEHEPDQGKLMEWRCAGGSVLACQYGANIPCESKAVTSQKPSQPISDYCKQNPGRTSCPCT